jgi:hypothetical protein
VLAAILERKQESMSVSNDSALTSTIDDGRALPSSTFLYFCIKVRNNDPSILPEFGKPFKIPYHMCEREGIELADALLENTSVTYHIHRNRYGQLYKKLCKGNNQVHMYQQALATHLLEWVSNIATE